MSVAWESFRHAALELVSEQPIKQRLINAFSKHLNEIQVDELPDGVRAEFRLLSKELTKVSPMRGETAVAATVRKMSNDEACACARQVVLLLEELNRQRHQTGRSRTRQLVPVFIAEAAGA